MAKIYPDIDTISTSHIYKTSVAELNIIRFLTSHLPDDYEVFFKPLINGDAPDFVVVKKTSGILIFNIVDHPVNQYSISEGIWYLSNAQGIKHETLNPFERGKMYKDNFFHLHIDRLQEYLRDNKNYYTIIHCGTFFLHDTFASVKERLPDRDKYHIVFSKDRLTAMGIAEILQMAYFNRTNQYFTLEIYHSFRRYLAPPIHRIEDGKAVVYTEEQERFIASHQEEKRIHGVAGSGKTFVLAKRAVNSHIRTKKRILILTYNKTLRNYIRDRINDVREEFSWNAFTILHYHDFFRSQALNHSLKLKTVRAYEDERFFDHVKERITKYDTLIIDEIQDYRGPWFRILKKYFLVEQGEFVVFGDSKQDIYQRKEMDTVPIPGRPSVLKKSYRLSTNIAALATRFQEYFFKGKHEIESIEVAEQQLALFSRKGAIEYYSIEDLSDFELIYDIINTFLTNHEVHPSDAAIISARTEVVAELDFFLRTKKHENTTTIFEPIEVRRKLKKEIEAFNKATETKSRKFESEIDRIRDHLKRHFEMNTGLIKLSSIHSFKGWETDTVFLIIEDEFTDVANTFTTEELIYVGLTRAKRNLIIINLGNVTYGTFFEKLLS